MIEPTPHVDPKLLADMREAARLDELSEARQQAIVSSVMKGVAGRRYSSSRTGEWLRRAATVVAALGMTKVTVALALGGGAALVAHQFFTHRPVAVAESSLTTPAPVAPPAAGESNHREALPVPAQVESEPVAPVVADPPRSHALPHAAAKSEPVATTAEPDGLRRETELLDGARGALLRGQPSAALATVSQYRQEFPKGRLGSAAGLVEAQALLAAGQPQRAADRARELLRTNRSGPFADKLRAIIAQVEH
jgi:hypothetical protein